jgi:hypothetical protein
MTRGDLRLDICGIPATYFVQLCRDQCFITNARQVKPQEDLASRECTGLSIGKNPKHLTIYDKFRQIIRKGDALYAQALIQRRWGEHATPDSTRIEFQLWQSTLQKCDISTPQQFLDHRRTLIDGLCREYFRFTASPVDRKGKHQSRAVTHPCWEEIIRAFHEIFAAPEKPLVPIDRTKVEPLRLAQMGRGCLLNALLQMGVQFKSYEHFAHECMRILVKLFPTRAERQKFMEEIAVRRMEHEIS